jgi:asparagine synthase (glutamine-hydrolysing)
MCGILGYIGHTTPELFSAALAKLAHRGPDGSGTWEEEGVRIGNRRLAILDLSQQAHQPMEAFDRYLITYNGEIYNFVELQKELEGLGEKFISGSDTEVVLKAWVRWGKDCLLKFNGMWAFAIWDKKEKTLFLSRDRLGKKPLFYHHRTGERFIFSSEMKGIYPFLDRIVINRKMVGKAMKDNFFYESDYDCLVENIHRFPAASWGVLKDGKLTIEKFWDVTDRPVEVPARYEDQCAMFRELLFDACRIRMRSDIPLAAALSGGLDSSAILASMMQIDKGGNYAERASTDWRHAFVASFPGTDLDETGFSQELAAALDVKTAYININPLLDIDRIFEQTFLYEEIYYASLIPFSQLYAAVRNAGYKVCIDGHGGDELFGGYPFDMVYALADAFPSLSGMKDIVNAMNNTSQERNSSVLNQLRFVIQTRLRERPVKPGMGFLNSRLLESTTQTILPTILRNYDRFSMMNSVEIRMPFLDHRIVQFAFSIPYTSKIRNGRSKAIIRDAFRGLVPENILNRKIKIGFNPPMHKWLNSSLREWALDMVNSADFKTSGLVNPAQVKKKLTAAVERKEMSFSDGVVYYNLLVPYIWERSLRCAAKPVAYSA